MSPAITSGTGTLHPEPTQQTLPLTLVPRRSETGLARVPQPLAPEGIRLRAMHPRLRVTGSPKQGRLAGGEHRAAPPCDPLGAVTCQQAAIKERTPSHWHRAVPLLPSVIHYQISVHPQTWSAPLCNYPGQLAPLLLGQIASPCSALLAWPSELPASAGSAGKGFFHGQLWLQCSAWACSDVQQGDEQVFCRGFHTMEAGDTSVKAPLPLPCCFIILARSRTAKNWLTACSAQ